MIMASVVDNEKTKKKCQIFTPQEIACSMLDYINYKNGLHGKKVLEGSCGDGQILLEVVKRYISDCRNCGLSDDDIKKGITSDLYAIELDIAHFATCIENLDETALDYGLMSVEWSIYNRDALRNPIEIEFDYILGNPPFVSYWDMDTSERKFIKEKFSICEYGTCDYSYAFIQDHLGRLAPNGKMVYIVPNNIFKTNSGRKLRKLLKPHITDIYDYSDEKVFSSVLTNPAIIVVNNSEESNTLKYHCIAGDLTVSIHKTDLQNIWVMQEAAPSIAFDRRFGDCFSVATCVATQSNDVFILNGWAEQDGYLIKDTIKIEFDAVRTAASPRGKKNESKDYIIFPYCYIDGNLTRYNEDNYKQRFPLCYNYLLARRDILNKRKADENALWFEFGRSQALRNLNTDKLLISSVVTSKVVVHELDSDEVPYSGIYITEKHSEHHMSLDTAREILQSDSFFRYLKSVGVRVNGASFRITARNICDYNW